MAIPRCLVVQHAVPESPYAIGDALLAAGVEIETRRVFADEQLPTDTNGFGGLVIMGGPMSARSDTGFASRRTELALIADALRHDVPTLGICLGAQLLAAASGAEVRKGESGVEIGWAPVELLDACSDDELFSGLPDLLTVLHWHGDTFELPAGTTRLMSNAAYTNQGFRTARRAWGLQFHLEVTLEAVRGFVGEFPEVATLSPGGASALLASSDDAIAQLIEPRRVVFGRFAALVASTGNEHGVHRI